MDDKDRDRIQDVINDSQNDFEKNLVYLSAGALTLSMGFIEKLVPLKDANHKCLLILAWCLLAFTLLLNLATHLISVRNSTKARKEIDAGLEYDILVERIECRNKIMRFLNWLSYLFFAFGVIFIVLFSSLNINEMSNDSSKKSSTSKKINLGRETYIPKNTVNSDKSKTDSNGKTTK